MEEILSEFASLTYIRCLNRRNDEEPDYTNIKKESIANRNIICDDACPVCDCTNLQYDENRGEWICSSCGTITESHCADQGRDWRAFTADEIANRSRTGAPSDIMKADKGLSTVMGDTSKDCNGSVINYTIQKKLNKLKNLDLRYTLVKREDNNFKKGMNELRNIAPSFNLSDPLKKEIAYRYKKIAKTNMRGSTIRTTIIALISIVCQEWHEPRPLKEIIRLSHLSERELNKNRRKVFSLLGLRTKNVPPVDYLHRISSILNIHGDILQTSIDILTKLERRAKKVHFPIGKDPAGIAAGTMYLSNIVHNGTYTQNQIGKSVNVTDVTVRNRYKELCKVLGRTLNPNYLRKG